MKTIKLTKNIKLALELNNDKELIIKLNNTDIKAYVNKCELCDNLFISLTDNTLCTKCDDYIASHNTNLIQDTQKEITINPLDVKKRKRAYSHVINYNKGKFLYTNIKITNLVECHNLMHDYMSIGKVETLLKFAILRLNYSDIATQLNLKEASVSRDFSILASRGLVSVHHNHAEILGTVKYSITDTAINESKIGRKISDAVLKNAHAALDSILTNSWRNKKYILDATKLNYHTLDAYLFALTKDGSLKRRGTIKEREFCM